MSTSIRVDVTLQRLQNQSRQATEQNRSDKQQREQAFKSAGLAPTAADVAAVGNTVDARAVESTGARVRSLFEARRPAAQRLATAWALWTADWLGLAREGGTGLFDAEGDQYVYRYFDAKDLNFLFTKQASRPSDLPPTSLSVAQRSYVYSAPLASPNVTDSNCGGREYIGSNGGMFANGSFVPGFHYTQSPVMASRQGVLYGVQRHSVAYTNTPWTRQISGPTSPSGVTREYLYVYFRFNSRTSKLDVKTDSATYTTTTGSIDVSPYVEGGSVWADKYLQNAFSGDPSLPLRAIGYYGDYHLQNGRASFLRRHAAGSSVYSNLYSSISRVLWGQGELLQWTTFDVGGAAPAELKVALEACLAEVPTQAFIATPAFKTQAELDYYNELSLAVVDRLLPTGEDQFYAPTGPYLYPLLLPPQ
jgi:hypothetical protein